MPPTAQTGPGRVLRPIIYAAIVLFVSLLLADIATTPTKRNIELLIGVLFVGIGYIARPILALCFAVFLVPFPMHTSVGSTTTLLILAVGILVLIKRKIYQLHSPFVYKPADLAIMGLALMMLLSITQLSSQYYDLALKRYVAFAAALTLYYLVVQLVRTPEAFRMVLKSFMAVAVVIGLIGTLQTLFPAQQWLPPFFRFSEKMAMVENEYRGHIRVFATFPGISSFGEFVGTSVLMIFALARHARSLAEKAFWIVGIILLLTALAGSATRMGVIILGGGFAYMLLFGRNAIPRVQLVTILFVAFSLMLLTFTFTEPVADRMIERLSNLGTDDSSVNSRWGVMEQAFDAIPNSPLLGHGIVIPPDTFRGPVSVNIHNLYLTLGYTIGIPGLIAFLVFGTLVFRRTLETLGNPRIPSELREYALVMHTSFVMFLVYQLTSDYVTHAIHMHVAWLRLGLLMAIDLICRRALQGDFQTAR